MPLYQITSILRASATQAEVSDTMVKFTNIVLHSNGVLAGINHWGLLELAYRMKAHQEFHTHGRYVQFKVVASPQVLKELERNMRLDPMVVRFMTLKEKNTSIATYSRVPPDQLAAAAHAVARQILEPERGGPEGAGFGVMGG
eukprot:CAMPEP_0173377936 /NCGR_PEP_ID=MMETSP1356-20130122/1193_1 /TAXON_ID=77927 ORGANISM="Hemiselmis virescens, Strain PCC157" /NCGR_SAMPLE_ID=MMETSP1356 /ASSEMBLY_ACC=CAM_ASM_000847 /LENGTH=142 /DNA_ID=CAMNT_0014330853 /DNA_START=223 /DNA_END=648 /DNA_ORIENTATION=+